MNKFKLVLGFYLDKKSADYQAVQDVLDFMAAHPDEDALYEQCDRLNEIVVREIPFAVWLDDEEWLGVDRTSQDTHIFLVVLEQAILTDNVLESLPSPEIDRIEAACWAIHNNEWAVQLMPIEQFDKIHNV